MITGGLEQGMICYGDASDDPMRTKGDCNSLHMEGPLMKHLLPLSAMSLHQGKIVDPITLFFMAPFWEQIRIIWKVWPTKQDETDGIME